MTFQLTYGQPECRTKATIQIDIVNGVTQVILFFLQNKNYHIVTNIIYIRET